MPVFQRLMGLETEYALRIPESLRESESGIHSHRDGYDLIVRSLAEQLPTAEADPLKGAKEGIFLGTGGAVWFESLFPAAGYGLIEGATPECRFPRDLLACQRAQDRLLGEAAQKHGMSLVKNCRDAHGNVYGSQESYEVTLAAGAALWFWRMAFLFILVPFTILLQFGAIVTVALFIATLPVTGVIYRLVRVGKTPLERKRLFDHWVGRVWRRGWNAVDAPLGGWCAAPLILCLKLLIAPQAAVTWAMVQMTALGRLQRQLTPFLMSRIVFSGAGQLESGNRFQLSEKAGSIASLANIPELSRPVFSLSQFMKPCVVVVRIGELWNPMQRIQISLSDSNLCEEAEYLRIGTTLLVLDAIESGAITEVPYLARSVKALKAFNNDPTLTARVRLRDGRSMTALEIQHWYYSACRRYVDGLAEIPKEVDDLLARWRDVLQRLATDRDSLIGRVDWITKQYLLEEAANDVSTAAKKKIDIKYHELSPGGYFRRLEESGVHCRVLSDEEVVRAMRLPPGGTPATTRARLIREFSGPGLRVGWKSLSNGMRIE